MRELTQQEIDSAPEWATHYFVCPDGDILYQSVTQYAFKELPRVQKQYGIEPGSKPIQRKPFHISDAWHSSTYNILDNGSIELVGDPTLDRNQVIDLAKHFNIKEDL